MVAETAAHAGPAYDVQFGRDEYMFSVGGDGVLMRMKMGEGADESIVQSPEYR